MSLTWEGKQLAGYTKGTDSLSFTYDDNGLRLSKTHNNETTAYYYNGSVLMSLVKGNDTLLFSYDQGGNVISVNYYGTDYYYLRNGQGDIVKLIDGSGSAVVEYSYNSWGEQTGCVGTLSTTLGILNPFRYRGYVYDEETGLYYLQSRYYDPDLCRFISADVFLSTGQGVLGCNAFAYCGNEPVIKYDIEGSKSCTILPWSGSAVEGNDLLYDTSADIGYENDQHDERISWFPFGLDGTIGDNGCGVLALHNIWFSSDNDTTFKYSYFISTLSGGQLITGRLGTNPLVMDALLRLSYGANNVHFCLHNNYQNYDAVVFLYGWEYQGKYGAHYCTAVKQDNGYYHIYNDGSLYEYSNINRVYNRINNESFLRVAWGGNYK